MMASEMRVISIPPEEIRTLKSEKKQLKRTVIIIYRYLNQCDEYSESDQSSSSARPSQLCFRFLTSRNFAGVGSGVARERVPGVVRCNYHRLRLLLTVSTWRWDQRRPPRDVSATGVTLPSWRLLKTETESEEGWVVACKKNENNVIKWGKC